MSYISPIFYHFYIKFFLELTLNISYYCGYELKIKQTEQIRAEKDNLYNAIWSSKISVRGKNGENITCENGLMQAVKNASEQILNLNGRLDTWRNTSAEELEHIANEYRKYGVDNWEDYEQAKNKKRSRGYGGMSYDD